MRRAVVLIASDWAPIRAFDPIIRADPLAVYGDMLPVLQQADLRVVNCECALTTCSKPVWKSGSVFKGEPDHVRALAAIPFDVVCLANNHVLDYGVAGLRDTLKVLARHNVRTVGAGLTGNDAFAPLTITVKRTRIHIVNFGEGEDLTGSDGGPGTFGWDIDRVVRTVAECRRRGGVVIAVGHCGLEYIPFPPPYVANAFRAIIEAGADCVVGHHPHVPQGIEWHDGRPIVYSLGNFVFYQPTDLLYRRTGFLVALDFDDARLSALRVHPYRITESGLRKLTPREAAGFRRTLARTSRPLEDNRGTEAAWQACLAFYGMKGFREEVQGILDRMKAEPEKAAAMFRNRITTMQHRELWRDVLTRVMEGEKARYSRPALSLVQDYFTRREAESTMAAISRR